MLHDDQVYDLAADIAGPPQGGKPEGWIYGVIIAGPIAMYGLYCLLVQRAWFLAIGSRFVNNRVPRRGPLLEEYDGRLAMALGLVMIAVALYLHFRYFWSQSRRLVRYYEIGQLAAILLFIAALGWWIFEFANKFF
jgi:hypothetical protein